MDRLVRPKKSLKRIKNSILVRTILNDIRSRRKYIQQLMDEKG